ncbi:MULTISPECIES: Uma2 family endonuclease [Spirulina sp. CCY15215]|uniref:Uma2 family endonuclease n=1 Tax=Spirulina sp. CCY15215 TaxID=2767591 RepID=UPI0019529CBD|nr:Uma2 family endonuclease [Spirulina major]
MQQTREKIIDKSSLLRLWTVEEYHYMAEVGILGIDESVELVAGQIIKKMSPQKTPHATALTLTRLLLEERLGKQVLVRTQLPITLSNYSEPEPDVAVVMPDVLRYLEHHPCVSEIYLIIEIADTTSKTDREIKTREYGKVGIKDYWVLDINKRCLHIFQDPTSHGYQNEIILEEDGQISPLQFPDLSITVRDLLPPVIVE